MWLLVRVFYRTPAATRPARTKAAAAATPRSIRDNVVTQRNSMSQTLPSAGTDTDTHGRTPKKAAVASFLGSAVEYYDFFIFGSAAALIFPTVFFPDADANAAIMSFATFGFAYVARPVGAVILGHFGDRVGRRKVLMFTLLLMGASTFLIGCLPDFNTVGWWAPALLVLARLCQGLSAAGEQAGASSMTL